LDVHAERGFQQIGFVTELVHGTAPRDNKQARGFLKALTSHFLEAGLPTWQVTPHNPRAVGNLIEEEDGTYRIIDLESNLVAPLMPLSGVVGAIRQGNFPAFDDIDLDRLNAYLARNETAIAATLGAGAYAELTMASEAYGTCVRNWRRDEPRIISRSLRLALRLVDVPSWIRSLRRMTENSRTTADRLVSQGIDQWEAEGKVTEEQAVALRAQSQTPEVASALAHMGAHVAMTIPLRFPFGSIARAAWTLVMRAKVEWDAIVRRHPAGGAREEHTLLVATASLVPGFGAAAYMLSKPLRGNRALAVMAFDRLSRKMPGRLYERAHLAPFMVYHAKVQAPAMAAPARRSLTQAVRVRLGLLRGQMWPIFTVLTLNAVIVVAGGILYFGYGTRVIFDERGVMNTVDAAQLVLAGIAGMAAYRAFWAVRRSDAPLEEAAGIMFWGIAGAGFIYLAADDYFTLHERMGTWMSDHGHMLPLFTNSVDDVITLTMGVTGLTMVYLFRAELLALRPSSVLMLAGVGAAALMTVTDVYGHGFIRPLEFPAQMSACGLLLLANIARYGEVKDAQSVTNEQRVPEAVAA
jgi:hypothetical protein